MRRALGKGLSQLIGEQVDSTTGEVPIGAIVPNQHQPRTIFDDAALDELAASIKELGIIQPLVVRALSDGKYELIAGERRLRAAKKAGLTHVPIVLRAAGNQESLQMALVENLQREDISPMECARAYKELADRFSMTQEQIAERVGKSRAAITNTLRLLRLPSEVQEGLESGLITEGHARALLQVDGASGQSELFFRIVDEGLSVREAERHARRLGTPKSPSTPRTGKTDPSSKPNANDGPLEEALGIYFGSPVKIQRSEHGGKLLVEFYSDEDLQRILEILGLAL